jgi:hypothetical protein
MHKPLAALLIALPMGCTNSSDSTSTLPAPALPSPTLASSPAAPSPPTCCAGPMRALAERPGELTRLVQIGEAYRAEIVLGRKGIIKVYPLAADAAQIHEVEKQRLEAQLRLEGGSEATLIYLDAVPQEGDGEGKTSQFVGTIPRQLWEKPLVVTMQMAIDRKRYRFSFPLPSGGHAEDLMPTPVPAEEEKLLYLTPGGRYTEEDIKANGRLCASQKYDLTGWTHELRPAPGEKLVPSR